MPSRNYHVVPDGDKWKVEREGADRASGIFDTQQDAAARGRELAQASGGDLLVHGRDGRIRDRDSYGHDPFPPRDTEH